MNGRTDRCGCHSASWSTSWPSFTSAVSTPRRDEVVELLVHLRGRPAVGDTLRGPRSRALLPPSIDQVLHFDRFPDAHAERVTDLGGHELPLGTRDLRQDPVHPRMVERQHNRRLPPPHPRTTSEISSSRWIAAAAEAATRGGALFDGWCSTPSSHVAISFPTPRAQRAQQPCFLLELPWLPDASFRKDVAPTAPPCLETEIPE